MKHLHRVCLLVVAITVIVSGNWVSAEPGPSVSVRFEVQSVALVQHWGPAGSGVIADVQKGLAARLKERLPHWEYQPVDPAGAQGPHLLFAITETKTGAMSFQVLLRAQNFSTPALIAPWLASHDIMLTGYPSPSTAASVIVSDISSRIFERHDADVRGWLSEHVPIAVGAHWIGRGTPPRLVLALPWSRYDGLRESVFRLICDWPNQGTAIVESVGPGLQAPYAPSPPTVAPNPPFDGVVVIAREREFAGERRPVDQIGQEVFELNPRLIYLKEYRPASDWNVGGRP